ncbi:unnamed protein product, partial [Prorocentrum cordatum]
GSPRPGRLPLRGEVRSGRPAAQRGGRRSGGDPAGLRAREVPAQTSGARPRQRGLDRRHAGRGPAGPGRHARRARAEAAGGARAAQGGRRGRRGQRRGRGRRRRQGSRGSERLGSG